MSIWLELYSNRLPMAWREIMSPACSFRNMDVNPFVSRPSLLVITACCIWIRKWSEWKISPRFSRVIWFPVVWSFGCMYVWMFSVQAPCLIQMKGNVAEKFSSSQTFCLLSLIIYFCELEGVEGINLHIYLHELSHWVDVCHIFVSFSEVLQYS